MLWLRIYTTIMLIPSTLLAVFLCYIILTKSPVAMRKYKYVMLCVLISFYQLDIVYSFLMCPVPLPRATGVQFAGILGALFPHSGKFFPPVMFLSTLVLSIAMIVSFVYREYSVIPFETKPIHIFLHFLHLAACICVTALFIPLYCTLLADESAILTHLQENNSTYDPEYALWCIPTPEKNAAILLFFIYVIVGVFLVSTYVGKAYFRVSPAYFTAIPFQGFVPLFTTCLAVCAELAVLQLLPLILDLPAMQIELVQREATAFLLSFPALFTSIHVFTVIWTTKPYRRYILRQKLRLRIISTVQGLQTRSISATVNN